MASTDQLHATNLFSMKDAVCLVTGGGTGIGLMASQALAANGRQFPSLFNPPLLPTLPSSISTSPPHPSRTVFILTPSSTTPQAPKCTSPAAASTSSKTPPPPTPSSSSTSSGGSIIPLGPCDVTSKADLESLSSTLSAKESHLSLLIAAAGIPGPKGHPDVSDASQLKSQLWSAESPEAWNETYNADVTSVFFSTVAFLPLLQKGFEKGHPASVIVISSMSGMMRHSQAHFAYNAAKAATAHLSRMMSREFAKTGVRVNSIAPGYFPSEMTMKESDERNKAEMPDEKVKDKGHEVPAGRAGRDEEMAMLVMFLARCAYVNGEVVKLDGGVMNEVGGG